MSSACTAQLVGKPNIKKICKQGLLYEISVILHSVETESNCLLCDPSFFKGCGKSVLVQQFANFLGYNIEPVVLYQVKTKNKSSIM